MKKTSQRGSVALECAMFMAIIAGVLLVAVEGANALHTYSTLLEATREGARMALRDGNEANVPTLVSSLTQDLPNAKSVTITKDAAKKTVKVEVSYAHNWYFWSGSGDAGNGPLWNFMSGSSGPYTIKASTTMPIP